jgi:hypothetical protein
MTGPDQAGAGEDAGFVDIATNLLAAVLIVTVLVVVASPRLGTSEASEGLRLLDPPREVLPPLSEIHLLQDDRIAWLDLAPIGEALLAPGRPRSGRIEMGEFRLQSQPWVGRDPDAYDLRLRPDPRWVATAPRLEPAALAAGLASRQGASTPVPLFMVRPSAMDGFAELHARLLAAGVRFRFVPVPEAEELRLFRDETMFSAYSFRR